MKSIILRLLSLFVLTACTVPSPSDFESAEKPLGVGEYIVIWRFPSEARKIEVIDHSPAYAKELEAAMKPFFEQTIPQIFSDLKNGRLELRESQDITDLEEGVINDIPSKMKSIFNTSWNDISPYTTVFHITQRRKPSDKGFEGQLLEFELIAKDPSNQYPENRLGAIPFSDLDKLDYQVQVEGTNYPISEFFDKTYRFSYPIAYYFENQEYGLTTLKQAYLSKEYVISGKWAELSWLGYEPNFSGLKVFPLNKEKQVIFEGVYSFESNQDKRLTLSTNNPQVELKIQFRLDEYSQTKRLQGKWGNKGLYFPYEMYPFKENAYFNCIGDRIYFEELPNGSMQIKIVDDEGRGIIGYRSNR
ncbi:MAG: hypothetical protein AAGD28_31580 [Bacteroidota bacterium]